MPRQLQDGFGCVRPLSVITPIARGGTAADNVPQAVSNLGGISRAKIDVPNGVAGADQNGYLKMKYLEAVGLFSGISLEGPTELVRSTPEQTNRPLYFVSNYHSPSAPVVTCDVQQVMDSMQFDWPFFSFDVPETGSEVTLNINGRDYVFPLISDAIQQPSILMKSGVSIPNAGMLRSSKYRTVGYTYIGDETNWTTLPEGETEIPLVSAIQCVNVYGRAGTEGLIEVSDGEDVLVFPSAQVMMSMVPNYDGTLKIFRSNATEAKYAILNNTMKHNGTTWEIASDFDFTNVVYSEDFGADCLLSLPVGLSEGIYYVRVRYQAGSALSAWSVPVMFKVEADAAGLSEKSITVDPSFAEGADFGYAVAIGRSGLLAIGSPTDPKGDNASGTVYAYKRRGYQSNYLGRISSPTGIGGERFGAAVSIRDDDRVFVGAPSINNGRVYFYDMVDGAFSLSGSIEPKPSSGRFGAAVKVIDNHLFIGDPFDNTNGEGTGAVHVYDFAGGEYLYKGAIYPQTPVNGGHFGCSIETDSAGDLLFIGATSPDPLVAENGMFYVFRKIAGNYSESEIRNSPMPSAGDGFGRGLAYDQENGKLYVGCEHDSGLADGAGAIYCFDVAVAASLLITHTSTLYPVNPDMSARYGTSLAMSRDGYCLFVGAPGALVGGLVAGSVHCLA